MTLQHMTGICCRTQDAHMLQGRGLEGLSMCCKDGMLSNLSTIMALVV